MRGIKEFSERDRVRFVHLPIGTVFLHRGARLTKTADDALRSNAFTHQRIRCHVIIGIKTRVIVTRKSRIALMAKNTMAKEEAPCDG